MVKKKVLVSGGAGFIGSHTVDMLIRNKYEVIIVDNLSTGLKENINPDATFYKVDITSKELPKIFNREKPDYVIHLAGQVNLRKSMLEPIFDIETNIIGSVNLLLSCIQYGISKIVFSSSGGARYGEPNEYPCKETKKPEPISIYGTSKISVENFIEMFSRTYGLDYIILALSNVYGPRQNPKGEAGVISIFLENMKKNKECHILGDGNQTRDFVYISDVTDAIMAALLTKTNSKIFNIGSGIPTSINKIFDTLCQLMNCNIPALFEPKVKGEIQNIYLDIQRANKELGYLPKIKLSDGLFKTIKWYKSIPKSD